MDAIPAAANMPRARTAHNASTCIYLHHVLNHVRRWFGHRYDRHMRHVHILAGCYGLFGGVIVRKHVLSATHVVLIACIRCVSVGIHLNMRYV
jgi:hypothetical protein